MANRGTDIRLIQKAHTEYARAQTDFDAARSEGAALAEKAGGTKVNHTNYIFLTFITRYLPPGMVGLVLAMILGATTLSTASDMNAVATVSIIDIYKRHTRTDASAGHYLWASRVATLAWGCYAVISAHYVKRMGSLIEAANLLGSFFYGGMLGVFVLAFFFRKVRGRGAFWGVLSGEAVIFACWYFTNIAYLWYNVIGCIVVVATGLIVTAFECPECREDLEPVFNRPSELTNSPQVWSPRDVRDITSESRRQSQS
jgi:SSS family solute:Na+ symporter